MHIYVSENLSSVIIKSIRIVSVLDNDDKLVQYRISIYSSRIKHRVNRYATYSFSIVSGLNIKVLYRGMTIAGGTG